MYRKSYFLYMNDATCIEKRILYARVQGCARALDSGHAPTMLNTTFRANIGLRVMLVLDYYPVYAHLLP